MDTARIIIALLIVVVIVMMVNLRGHTREGFIVDLATKVKPRADAEKEKDKIVIDSIPLSHETPQIEIDDQPRAPVYADEKPHISLTFDASVARNALLRSRDKRVFDAIANRTTEYYRPFYEEELMRCEYRDWWDDVSYPMNDSGEYTLTPEISPYDRYETPWEASSVGFPRSV